MRAQMLLQSIRLPVRFLKYITSIQQLPSMSVLMLLQVIWLIERFPTYIMFKQSFPCMRAEMHPQGT